jgi:hypothetical protein
MMLAIPNTHRCSAAAARACCASCMRPPPHPCAAVGVQGLLARTATPVCAIGSAHATAYSDADPQRRYCLVRRCVHTRVRVVATAACAPWSRCAISPSSGTQRASNPRWRVYAFACIRTCARSTAPALRRVLACAMRAYMCRSACGARPIARAIVRRVRVRQGQPQRLPVGLLEDRPRGGVLRCGQSRRHNVPRRCDGAYLPERLLPSPWPRRLLQLAPDGRTPL